MYQLQNLISLGLFSGPCCYLSSTPTPPEDIDYETPNRQQVNHANHAKRSHYYNSVIVKSLPTFVASWIAIGRPCDQSSRLDLLVLVICRHKPPIDS